MDRIDSEGANGIAARLRMRLAAPISPSTNAQPAVTAAPEQNAKHLIGLGLAGAEAGFDQARVASIRKALEQGRYQIDPARIADAMIAAGFVLKGK